MLHVPTKRPPAYAEMTAKKHITTPPLRMHRGTKTNKETTGYTGHDCSKTTSSNAKKKRRKKSTLSQTGRAKQKKTKARIQPISAMSKRLYRGKSNTAPLGKVHQYQLRSPTPGARQPQPSAPWDSAPQPCGAAPLPHQPVPAQRARPHTPEHSGSGTIHSDQQPGTRPLP